MNMDNHALYTSQPPTAVTSQDLRSLPHTAPFHIRNDGVLVNYVSDQNVSRMPSAIPSSVQLLTSRQVSALRPQCQSAGPIVSQPTIPISAGLSSAIFGGSKLTANIYDSPKVSGRTTPDPTAGFIKVERTITNSRGKTQTVTIGFKNMKRTGVGYEVGFSEIDVSNQELYEIPEKLINPRASILNVSHNYLQSLASLKMPYLKELDVSHNEISEFGDFGFIPIALLVANFSKNFISEISRLNRFPLLKSLNLSNNQISSVTGLDDLQNLTKLDLSHNRISELPEIRIATLQELILSHNDLAAIPEIKGCVCLQYLDLAANNISDLQPLRYSSSVIRLYLQDNQVEDIHQLDHLKPLLNLRVLKLYPNPISSIGLYRMMIIFALPHLAKFDSQTITATEKIEAKRLFAPDFMDMAFQDRLDNILERANQSANILLDEYIHKRSLPPIILLVGPPMSRCSSLVSMLKNRYRDKILMGGVHSTVTTLELPTPNKDIPVSYETYEAMKNRGEFMARSHILGRACGFTSSQILRASERSTVLVASVPLTVALTIMMCDILPKIILVMPPLYENPYLEVTKPWDKVMDSSDDERPSEYERRRASSALRRAVTFITQQAQEEDQEDEEDRPGSEATTQVDSEVLVSEQDTMSKSRSGRGSKNGEQGSKDNSEERGSKKSSGGGSAAESQPQKTEPPQPLFAPVKPVFVRLIRKGEASPHENVSHRIHRHKVDMLCEVPSYELVFMDNPPSDSSERKESQSSAASSRKSRPSSVSSKAGASVQVDASGRSCITYDGALPSDGGLNDVPSKRQVAIEKFKKEDRSSENTDWSSFPRPECCAKVGNLEYPLLPKPVYCIKSKDKGQVKCYEPLNIRQETFGMYSGIFFDENLPKPRQEVSTFSFGETAGEFDESPENISPPETESTFAPQYDEFLGEEDEVREEPLPSFDQGPVRTGSFGDSKNSSQRGSSRKSRPVSFEAQASDTDGAPSEPPLTIIKHSSSKVRQFRSTSSLVSSAPSTSRVRASIGSSRSAQAITFSVPAPVDLNSTTASANLETVKEASTIISFMLPTFTSDHGKPVHLQRHQQAIANCIIKTREEYIKFHHDHPGLVHTLVDDQHIDDAFSRVCHVVDQTLDTLAEVINRPNVCNRPTYYQMQPEVVVKKRHDERIFQKHALHTHLKSCRQYISGNA